MQQSNNDITARNMHRQMQGSTTLNRRYVRRPTKSADVAVAIKKRSAATMAAAQASRPSARELKDQAIKKALAEATLKTSEEKVSKKTQAKKENKIHFGMGRVVLALASAAVAVFAIVYFVNLNMPDISLRVAAMQTGINASYPGYVPRDYNISSITSENGKVTMNFVNNNANTTFTLVEEASSWDSNALMTNFVKPTYGDNYSIVREQGLTIYISNSNAAWVNGGVSYKITADSNILTNKQIKSIATSL